MRHLATDSAVGTEKFARIVYAHDVSRHASAAARLAPGYQERVFWQTQAHPPAIDPHAMAPRADVVIVGAGYCGLSAARELARGGRSVVVVERDPIGFGASTRNGGMVLPELKAGPATLEKKYGAVGRRAYREVNDAFDHVEALITDEGIDCDYHRDGQLYLAHNRAHVTPLQAMAAEHGGELGEPVYWVPADELADEIGSTAFHGGVVLERSGGLHPAKYHAGLLRLALAAGADVHDHTTATAIESRAGGRQGFRVTTGRGTIDAEHVIIATNAYADGLVPWLRRRVVPVGSYIIATEVLDPALAADVSPRNRMLVDTKNFLFYWRLSPDGRVLFGGRRSLAAASISEARDFLHESMLKIHPQLAGAGVEYAWGGHVAVTLDRLPHFGRVPSGPAEGAIFATGCNGSGVALNSWLGVRAADVIAGGELPAFADLAFTAIPMHAARSAYLPVVGRWFAFQDARP
jgi:glycine/D-amino acid oxidase-like deaminating enzyme